MRDELDNIPRLAPYVHDESFKILVIEWPNGKREWINYYKKGESPEEIRGILLENNFKWVENENISDFALIPYDPYWDNIETSVHIHNLLKKYREKYPGKKIAIGPTFDKEENYIRNLFGMYVQTKPSEPEL